VRMGGARPKTLLEVGGRKPLLFYLLRGLHIAGVPDLVVVTGFAASEVQAYVQSNWNDAVTFVRNARYASWGNFHSLRVAIDQSPGHDLLVLNSDIVVHPEVVHATARAVGDLVLAVERRDALEAEEMRVSLIGERVTAIGKHLDMAHSHGEFVGVSLLRPPAADLYARVATALEWRAETSVYYEDVYARMLDALDVRAVSIPPGRYAEVDEPGDVARAGAVLDAHEEAWGLPSAAMDEPA
jgi:choline kinase